MLNLKGELLDGVFGEFLVNFEEVVVLVGVMSSSHTVYRRL